MNAPVTTAAPAEILKRDEATVLTRFAAEASASTWNPQTWQFSAVLATEAARVPRFDVRGLYEEGLSLAGNRWPETVPLLDSHNRGSVAHRLGSVDNLQVIGGELLGRVTLSRHHPVAQQLAQDLDAGMPVPVSIGYMPQSVSERTNPSNKRREIIVDRFDLVEVSAVTVPADRRAGSRSLPVPITSQPGSEPDNTNPPATPPTVTTQPAATSSPATTDRAAVNAEIRSIAQVAGLDQSWIDARIDAGDTADAARTAAFEAMRTRTTPPIRHTTIELGADYTAPEFRARTIGEALYTRATPGHTPSEAARPYTTMTMIDVARDCLRVRGISTTGLNPMTTIERALHTTSDFPLLLGDLMNRSLQNSYRAVGSALKPVARQNNTRDFRTRHKVQISEAPRLEKVNEAGEIKSGTFSEAKESYRLATYARKFGVTRQVIVNDDLGAFTDAGRKMGQGAAATEAQLLVDILTANSGAGPTMSDGNPLFHSTHKNLATVPGTPWKGETPPAFEGLIAAGRLAMRKQVGLSGELIAVTPRYLIVPSAGETAAEKALAAFTPTRAEDVNPFRNLTLVVEPRLPDDDAWYIAADPAEVDGLEWAYLEGAEGPQVDSRASFDVDGLEMRVRLDFGAGFVDWRSWFRNAGT